MKKQGREVLKLWEPVGRRYRLMWEEVVRYLDAVERRDGMLWEEVREAVERCGMVLQEKVKACATIRSDRNSDLPRCVTVRRAGEGLVLFRASPECLLDACGEPSGLP